MAWLGEQLHARGLRFALRPLPRPGAAHLRADLRRVRAASLMSMDRRPSCPAMGRRWCTISPSTPCLRSPRQPEASQPTTRSAALSLAELMAHSGRRATGTVAFVALVAAKLKKRKIAAGRLQAISQDGANEAAGVGAQERLSLPRLLQRSRALMCGSTQSAHDSIVLAC